MPSTIEVRSLASSAIQSCRYHRSMACTCSAYSLPAAPETGSVRYSSFNSASSSARSGSRRHATLPAPAISQPQSSSACLCAFRSLAAMTARMGHSRRARAFASPIFSANSSASTVQR